MSDICTCGLCEVETCDLCEGPVAVVDADGEAWCATCHAAYRAAQARLEAKADLEDCDVRFPVRRRALTRAERLEGLADLGIDTWDDYDGRV